MRRSLIIAILLFTGPFGLAQTGQYVFTNYTTAQGLADNQVQSLLTDSRGFLWAATAEGLSRFDGRNFKNYYANRHDSVLQDNTFRNLVEYKRGHLLLFNANRLVGFNTFTGTFYSLPVSHMTGSGLTRSATGDTWYFSAGGKVYLLNNQLQVTDSIMGPEPGAGNCTMVAPIGPQGLLLQCKDHFYQYNRATRSMTLLAVVFNFPGTAFMPFFRYYDAAREELYFAEYSMGLYRYSMRNGHTERLLVAANGVPYTDAFVYQMVAANDSTWWLLTERGIRIWNRVTNQISTIQADKNNPTGLAGNAVFATCTDRYHNRWLGTIGGISKLNASSLHIVSWSQVFKTSEGSGLMSLVKGRDANMYASVYLGKASTVNTRTREVKEWLHPANTGNWNLFVRGEEVVRTGVGNRLLAYNTLNGQYKVLNFLQPFYPDVELVVMGFVHSNGDEWYCANRGGGFVRKPAGSNVFKTYKKGDTCCPFTSSYYTSYAEDKKGNLWFGVNKTDKLVKWDMATDRFSEVDFEGVKGVQRRLEGINAVAADVGGNIWVAFNGAGLVQYMPAQNTAQHYTIADGLPGNFITGLRFDAKQRLWITTPKGLSCFIGSENKFVNFRREDGLPADNFTDYCNYYDTATNRLWLGAHSVLMQFNPDTLLSASRKQFPVYIDELLLNGKAYDTNGETALQLKASENNLQFHFVGVDLDKGKDIEYSYRLLGADADWNPTGTNQTASYANLKPGEYSFTVRGRYKGDNHWNEVAVPLRFTIATPWNRSWWFLLLAAAAVAGLIGYLVKSYYTRRIERERGLLEKQKAIEQERTRIATDMHDDFGANLSRIKFLSEKMKLTGKKDTSLVAELNKISGYSDEMAEKMGEIVWALNQRYDTLGDLVAFCRAYASEYLEAHTISLVFAEMTGECKLAGETRRNIFLVLKEGLHNTVKHANATRVQISFRQEQKRLRIMIRDNGRGMPEAYTRPFANGLANMQKRILDAGGEIRLYNDGGMVVDIVIPLEG